MNKFLSLLALAVLTVGLLGSCSKINERLDNLEKDVNGLKNEKIASIESQIAGITSSIADLGTIRSDISSLKQSAENHSIDIINLEEADRALKDRIDNLEDYLDVTLPKFAEKEWVEATFSTLEQYEETCDAIAEINVRIGELDARTARDIQACADSMKTWVNEQLDAYYIAAGMDAKLAQMKSAVDSARAANKITDAKADSISRELAKTKTAVDTAKANIRKEYKAAIKSAIDSSEARLTKKIQNKIDKVNKDVEDLAGRVSVLEAAVADLTGRVEALEGMIQSVVIVPAYSDGSVKIANDSLYIDCIVSPSSVVEELDTAGFSILINKVKTKAYSGADTIKIREGDLFEKDDTKGTVSVRVSVAGKIPAADSTITVAVNIKKDKSDYTTEFVPVTVAAAKPTVEYVEIGGLKWATKNLGAEKETDYGYYFAWGGTEGYVYSDSQWKSVKDGSVLSGGFSQANAPYYSSAYTKYTSSDSKTVLVSGDDAATAFLGSGWRMPTSAEFKALYDACGGTETPTAGGSTSTTEKGVYWCDNYDGVKGLLFCDGTNKLFFPAAGFGRDASLTNAGSNGCYWSSSLYTDDTGTAYYLFFSSGNVYPQYNFGRSRGFSVRPVTSGAAPAPQVISVENVSLNKSTLELAVGSDETLTATVTPDNATDKSVSWSSSDESVATVDASGKVTAVAAGTATITVTTEDGSKTATCAVTVVTPTTGTTGTAKATIGGKDVDVKWVQLWAGGPKFAEYNIGAENNKAEDYGGYYTWGGSINMSNSDYNTGSDPLSGDTDTATKLWGSNWRMPTNDELSDAAGGLLYECTCVWTPNYNNTDVNGLLCTGKGAYASNSVFLPAAGGCFDGGSVDAQGDGGFCWSSTPGGSDYAFYLYFHSDVQNVGSYYRNNGYSVRAVLAE